MENPYAPPVSALEATPEVGVWREGKLLVMAQGASLPCRCVKCNAPAAPGKRRKVYWHHPAIFGLLMVWLLYLIVALIARKSAEINPSLCPEHARRRLLGIWIGWGGSILCLIIAIVMASQETCIVSAVAICGFFAAMVIGVRMSRTVFPARIDDRQVRLKGCGEAFLASLPTHAP